MLLVTGASRGIGAAVATLAAQRGYNVAVNYNSGAREVDAIVNDIVGKGGRAIKVQADVSDESQILRMFETVDRELGPLTALVNNAGITGGFARVEGVSAAAIERLSP